MGLKQQMKRKWSQAALKSSFTSAVTVFPSLMVGLSEVISDPRSFSYRQQWHPWLLELQQQKSINLLCYHIKLQRKEAHPEQLDIFWHVLDPFSSGCVRLGAPGQALLSIAQFTSAPRLGGLKQNNSPYLAVVMPIHAAINQPPYLL